MIEDWVFMAFLLLISCLFLFHGLVLLFAPDKYPPAYEWRPYSTLELRRKPPLYLSRRFLGLGLSALMLGWPIRHVILWMLRPTAGKITYGDSPLPAGTARWDLLGFGIVALACGLFLIWKPQASARLLYGVQSAKIEAAEKFRYWTIYVRIAGMALSAFSLLLINYFIQSLR